MSTETAQKEFPGMVKGSVQLLEPEYEVDYEALPEGATLAAQCLAGAFAGILEHTVMYPVDALKTRMQAPGGLGINISGGQGSSVMASLGNIASVEGWRSLWRGTLPVVLGAGPAHAVYFGTYEIVKAALLGKDDGSHQPLKIAVAGTAATIVSEALMNPFDVIKQRMQLDGHTSMRVTCSRILRTEGIRALYCSYPATLVMSVPFTALNFVVYESTTKVINPSGEHDPFKHCIAGGIAGGVAAALTTPLDCVKTLLQIKGMSSNVRVQNATSLWDAVKIINQTEGLKGFWKGTRPRIVSNVPSTAICWTAYEMAKYYLMKQR